MGRLGPLAVHENLGKVRHLRRLSLSLTYLQRSSVLIFSVGENLKEIEQIDAGSFTSFSIWERTHIQEWIRTNPKILGEELLIVSMEFDRFVNSSDRLDLLALDAMEIL